MACSGLRKRGSRRSDNHLPHIAKGRIELPSTESRRPWDADQIAILKGLIERKISLARAAVILKRRQAAVQIQARKLGTPFPGVRATKAALNASVAAAEALAGIRR